MRRALAIARAAWSLERTKGKAPLRRRDELEFLPAAVEVIETPASPVGRSLLWTVIALATLAVGWSWVAELDVVAVASGRVVSTGRSKVIQPLETGIVRAIHVEDGKSVKTGDVLIELDSTYAAADQERLTVELMTARIEAARLQAALAADPERAFDTAAVEGDPLVKATNRALLISQVAEHRARLASLAGDLARRRADRAAIETTIAKFQRTIPLVRERADARTTLAEKGYSSRLQALELQQQLVEQEQELAVSRHRLDEANAAITSLQRQMQQLVAEYEKSVLVQLAETEKRISGLAQERLKAEQRRGLQTLTAPIDGIVQQLSIHTIGGVVTPAQTLLVLAPKDDPLEVEALVMNKDIGFVEPGQEATIKLETFLFTKYGVIPGYVTSISRDAVKDDRLGLVYPARVALERTTLDIGGRSAALAAGMVVTAEIKTERRRVIEYLLSPIMKYQQESLRER